MNSFWKNEWNMFTKEVDTTLSFLMQPVKFSSKADDNLMLKPSADEIVAKSETTTFWKNEWNMFTKEIDSAVEYLMQPVNFK
jgi:hypothetical protein